MAVLSKPMNTWLPANLFSLFVRSKVLRHSFILETRSGVVVEPYDVEAIKKALLDLVHGRVFFTPDYCAISATASVYQTQQLG